MDKKRLPEILAIYLPQFHETEDNNRWWGKGFTDWETVKNAERYFPGHKAPWHPLNSDFYDLSKHKTMLRQAELAKQYGIDGFCFYHYYFKNGKKELELPAENLLRWKDVNMPFCFNWASESWIRSWSKIEGNVWSEKYEKVSDDTSSGVLVLQDYGREREWKKHFEYLLPFFKDDRYIKIDNKPVFIFYRPIDIKPLKQMSDFWRRLADAAGLEGLYLIGANMNASGSGLDASIIYEPRKAINGLNSKNKARMIGQIRCYDYKEVWEEVLDSEPFYYCKTFFTGVTGYDDTPRRGRNGECMTGNSPEIFREGVEKLLIKSIENENEFVFINAWNEWGEGMYLEPDEQNQFDYLIALRKAKKQVERNLANIRIGKQTPTLNTEIEQLQYEVKKYKTFIGILDKWLILERENKINFKLYFEERGIGKVAIYGMAIMGKQLYLQLLAENVIVSYGIDRYVGQFGNDLKVYRPGEDYPCTDAIIITSYDTEEIERYLRKKCRAKIYLLEELIEFFWKKSEKLDSKNLI